MLATEGASAKSMLKFDLWVGERKYDGRRLIVETVHQLLVTTVAGFSRRGDPTNVPDGVAKDLASLPVQTVLDGELVDSKFFVFDILEYSGRNTRSASLEIRRQVLNLLFADADACHVVLVEQAVGEVSKLELLDAAVSGGWEGIVWKNLNSKYVEGRSMSWLKQKFVKQIDVVIVERGETKDNFVYGFWDGSKVVAAGKVSSLTGDGPKLGPGDVATIEYLYMSDSGKLVQPVTPRMRTDKTVEECVPGAGVLVDENIGILGKTKGL